MRIIYPLRGYAAYLEVEGVPPVTPWRKDGYHPILEKVYSGNIFLKRFWHLIRHSDSGGCYFPIDFPNPIILKDVSPEDASVGSSQRLLAELEELNLHLKMPSDYPPAGSFEFYDLVKNDPWETEKYVWATLHWFARESTSRNLLLCFG